MYEKWELPKTKPQELNTKMSFFSELKNEGYMYLLVFAGSRMSHKFWPLRTNLTKTLDINRLTAF